MDFKNNKINIKKDIFYGFAHLLVAFTSIVVVASIIGLPLPNVFLFCGIGTLIFKLITKNKIPLVMGISGGYIASMLFVKETYGTEYMLGGVIVAGIIYLIFGLIMMKWQDKVLRYLPKYILNMAIVLIGLSLLPIVKDMIGSNVILALISIMIVLICNRSKNQIVKMVSIPLAIIISTIINIFVNGVDLNVLNQTQTLQFIMPKVNFASIFTIGIVAIAILGELLGDIENTSNCIKRDLFKEVGIGRISIGNGVSSIVSAFGGSAPATSYSENTGFLLMSGYHNPNVQIWTSLFYILLAFATPLISLLQLIPQAAFGGVAIYLYSLITINALKELTKNIDLEKDTNKTTVVIIMLATFFMNIVIGSVTVSSIAVAMLFGIVLNIIFNKINRKEVI
ncbi:uracil-xanthine permease family protein [Clostridium perfringens]|uniref:uracil-xanthine permease family protein n=1 Tax=Clostridium perfringens TaxID=1502 RepID=UPI00096A606E|nr:solute carrier family 23 protein [Clostridium perfringens]